MQAQTKIFAHLVGDFMHQPRVIVPLGTLCDEVIRRMVQQQAQCCVVTDRYGKLAGVLRISDILKRVVFKVGPDTLIEDIMDSYVLTVEPEEYLYHAIGRMRRRNVKELVVVNTASQPVGVLYLQEAVEVASQSIMTQIDRLSGEGGLDSLRGIKQEQVQLARSMIDDNLMGFTIQQLLTHVNNDIYGRIVQDNVNRMQEEGWGQPPVHFCVIVMGSGGRGENYLYPDQDNGFILEDYPDEDHTLVDNYFRELAGRMCADLNEVGFPYCKGNVMATNPVWRKSISQWRDQVTLWGNKRNSVALRLADIFFDFQPVWGKRELAHELRQNVLKTVQGQHFFLQEMFASQVDHSVGLTMLGRLLREPDGPNKGMVDIKYRGLLPLVESVRLLALKQGLEETHTLHRIEKLHEAQILSDVEADYLTSAFRFMTHFLLVRQVREYEKGQPVTRFVNPKLIVPREKENLKRAYRHIEAFRKRLKGEFTGDVF